MLSLALSISSVKTKHQTQAKQAKYIYVKWEKKLSSEADVLITSLNGEGKEMRLGLSEAGESQPSVHVCGQMFLTPPLLCGHIPPLTRILLE